MDVKLNNYRFEQIGGKYLITTDHGSHCFLNEKEFNKLKDEEFDDILKKKLLYSGILLNDSNLDRVIDLTRKRNSFLFSGPSLHIIVVTLRCNMDCIYCHASSKQKDDFKYDMDLNIAKQTVDFIFQSPSENIRIEFQGGEPTLNWGIVKYIIEYALEKNLRSNKLLSFSIVTNMVEMDDKKMEYLIENDVGVCSSLDGPKDLHDYNRKYLGGSNYEIVTKWIKKFKHEYESRGKIKKVNALVTLTKKSMDKPKEIIDEYIKLGLGGVHLRFLNMLGFAKYRWAGISYSVKEYVSFWLTAMCYIDELNQKGIKIEERIVKVIFDKINSENDANYLDMRSPCGAVIGQLAYNYDGSIYSCDEGRMVGEDIFLLGSVRKGTYDVVVAGEKSCSIINSSLNDQYFCDDCVFKPFCGVCPVCNYVEQGSIIGKIPQTARCKVFKEQFRWVIKERFLNKNTYERDNKD